MRIIKRKTFVNILRATLVCLIISAVRLKFNRLFKLGSHFFQFKRSSSADFIFPTEEKSFHFGKFKTGIDGVFESTDFDEFSGQSRLIYRNISFLFFRNIKSTGK